MHADVYHVCVHMRACICVFVHSRCEFVCGMHVCDHEGMQASMYKCLYNFYHFLDMVQQKEPITEYCSTVGQLIQKYLLCNCYSQYALAYKTVTFCSMKIYM